MGIGGKRIGHFQIVLYNKTTVLNFLAIGKITSIFNLAFWGEGVRVF